MMLLSLLQVLLMHLRVMEIYSISSLCRKMSIWRWSCLYEFDM